MMPWEQTDETEQVQKRLLMRITGLQIRKV